MDWWGLHLQTSGMPQLPEKNYYIHIHSQSPKTSPVATGIFANSPSVGEKKHAQARLV